jgi:phospholipid/cholesterol/gamma-HCH transport system ATP-binding protein
VSTHGPRPLIEGGLAASPFAGGRRLSHRVSHLLEQAADYEREHGPSTPPEPSPPDPVAVEFRDVRTEVDGVVLLDHVTLRILAGRRTTVVGLTGPGKGAFVDQCLGRWWPNTGEVIVLGESTAGIRTEDDRAALGRRFGLVLRDGGLFSSWSVYDNIAVLLRNEHGIHERHVASLVGEILGEVGLTEQAALLPESLAIGQRKRGGIARALVSRPEVVIIDELEAGVEGPRAQLLAELIVHLHQRRGGAFLLFTQDLDTARETADELVLFSRGRLVASGSPAVLERSPNPHVRTLISPGGG